MQKYAFIAATLIITSCAFGSGPAPAKSYAEKIAAVEQAITNMKSATYHPTTGHALKALDEFLATSHKLARKDDRESIQAQDQATTEFHSKVLAVGAKKYVVLLRYQSNLNYLEQRKTQLMLEEATAEVARLKALLPAQDAPPAYAVAPSGDIVVRRCTSPSASSK